MTTQENRRAQRDERRGRTQVQHAVASVSWERPMPTLDFELNACEQALATLRALGHAKEQAHIFVETNAAAIKSKAREFGEEALSAAKTGQYSIELSRATLNMRTWLLSEYENAQLVAFT